MSKKYNFLDYVAITILTIAACVILYLIGLALIALYPLAIDLAIDLFTWLITDSYKNPMVIAGSVYLALIWAIRRLAGD